MERLYTETKRGNVKAGIINGVTVYFFPFLSHINLHFILNSHQLVLIWWGREGELKSVMAYEGFIHFPRMQSTHLLF